MANVTTIYACTDDGLAIFNKPGTLNEWLPPRRVLVGNPVRSVWAEAGPPVRVVAMQGGNLLMSESGGRNWEKVGIEHPVIDLFPGETESKIYAALAGDLLSSEDGGSSWSEPSPLPGRGTGPLPLRGLVTVRGIIYLIQGEALYKGGPEKGAWRVLIDGGIKALAYNEGAGELYAVTDEGITMTTVATTSAESADVGEIWTSLLGSPRDGLELLAVPGAAGRPPALVVVTSEGISVSPDGGETWQQKEIEGRTTALARDPERRDRLYAGTHKGFIFESGNRGQVWTQVNAAPLPSVIAIFPMRI